jgi:[ribosomal protein S5]-alanine N-acetyltransferase
MAVLDWITPDPGLVLEGETVRLRAPRMGDYAAWAELRQESRAFLQPWEPAWPEDDLTKGAYRCRLGLYARDIDLGYGFPFFVFRRSDGELLGGVNLRDVKRGVSQSAAIGYWVGQRHARHGYTQPVVPKTRPPGDCCSKRVSKPKDAREGI